jgi:hypothetical protein
VRHSIVNPFVLIRSCKHFTQVEPAGGETFVLQGLKPLQLGHAMHVPEE